MCCIKFIFRSSGSPDAVSATFRDTLVCTDEKTGKQLYAIFIPLIDGQAKCSLKVSEWFAPPPFFSIGEMFRLSFFQNWHSLFS